MLKNAVYKDIDTFRKENGITKENTSWLAKNTSKEYELRHNKALKDYRKHLKQSICLIDEEFLVAELRSSYNEIWKQYEIGFSQVDVDYVQQLQDYKASHKKKLNLSQSL